MPFAHNVTTSSTPYPPSVPTPSPQHCHAIGGSVGMKGGAFYPSNSAHISIPQHTPTLPKLIMTPPSHHSPCSSSQENNVVTLRTDDILQKDHSWKTLLRAIFRWKTQGPQKPSSSKIEVSGNRVLIPSSFLKTPSETPADTSPSSPQLIGSHHSHMSSTNNPFNTTTSAISQQLHQVQNLNQYQQSVPNSIVRTNRGSSTFHKGNRTSASFHLIRNSQARLESIAEGSEASTIAKQTSSVSEGRPNSEMLKRRGLRLDFPSGHLWDDASSPLDMSLSSAEASCLAFGASSSPGYEPRVRSTAGEEISIH
jgi:hypothetical protein